MKRIALTLTTINIPHVLENLVRQIIPPNTEVHFVIVGDKRTPIEIESYIANLPKRPDIFMEYLDVEKQKNLFSDFTELWSHIPFNSFSRRNFGDLYALQRGANFIIRIDDDNFPCNQYFLSDHIKVFDQPSYSCISGSDGWVNICEPLIEARGIPIYPRGFPFERRFQFREYSLHNSPAEVAINCGLWLGDPDVDAITRLAVQPEITSFNENHWSKSFVTQVKNWAPINTQNTSYRSEVAKLAFVSPHVGRFDDIFSGYILRSILDNHGKTVSYGVPLVRQVRNQHDLWSDESLERFGNTLGARVIEFCKNFTFNTDSLLSNYREIALGLEKEFTKIKEVCLMSEGMVAWLTAVEKM